MRLPFLRLLQFSRHNEPGFGAPRAKCNVGIVRSNRVAAQSLGFNFPSGFKRFVDLALGDSPRSMCSWLILAEAQQKEPAARSKNTCQVFDVKRAIIVAENVK